MQLAAKSLTCIPDSIVEIATSAASLIEGKLHIATCNFNRVNNNAYTKVIPINITITEDK